MSSIINARAIIDERPISKYQYGVFALCASVALLDGADTQAIGLAAPLIADSLKLTRAELGPIFSASLFGAMIGALSFGLLADRIGRKRVLIIATAVFALFTAATAQSTSLEMIIAFRLLAGLGLGGATPCFLALASEFAPERSRATVAAAMFAAFPFGIILGGLLNSFVMAKLGWQAVFYIGGILPAFVAVALFALLPESIGFLLLRQADQAKVASALRRIARDLPRDANLRIVTDERKPKGASLLQLFSEGRAGDTLLLWGTFFLGFGTLAVVSLWMPTLLRDKGIEPASAAFAAAFVGFGSCVGGVIAGKLMERLGAHNVLLVVFLLGGLSAVVLGQVASSVGSAAAGIAVIGFFLGIATSGIIALATMIYPTAARSTGIGWAMGMGRFGQTLFPLAAGLLVGWQWHTAEILALLGFAPVVAAACIILLRLRAKRYVPAGGVGMASGPPSA
jgi:AAHS family 4-hydroxybenzoate transporter-like MFS transporter